MKNYLYGTGKYTGLGPDRFLLEWRSLYPIFNMKDHYLSTMTETIN